MIKSWQLTWQWGVYDRVFGCLLVWWFRGGHHHLSAISHCHPHWWWGGDSHLWGWHPHLWLHTHLWLLHSHLWGLHAILGHAWNERCAEHQGYKPDNHICVWKRKFSLINKINICDTKLHEESFLTVTKLSSKEIFK